MSDAGEPSDLIALDVTTEGGRRWLRLEQDRKQWEEPIEEWKLVFDFVNGTTCYNSRDGRQAMRPPDEIVAAEAATDFEP